MVVMSRKTNNGIHKVGILLGKEGPGEEKVVDLNIGGVRFQQKGMR